MGSFTTGFCVGLGLSLLFTPKKGEEMRHLVGERIRALRASSPENQGLTPLVTQTRPRLEEVPNRAEPAMAMGVTTPTVSPVQQTASSMRETQQEMNRAAQQMGATPPITSPVRETTSSATPPIMTPVRETTSSAEEVQQELNRDVQQAGSIIPDTTLGTASSVEDTQKDLNRVVRPPRTGNPPPPKRPGSLTDQ